MLLMGTVHCWNYHPVPDWLKCCDERSPPAMQAVAVVMLPSGMTMVTTIKHYKSYGAYDSYSNPKDYMMNSNVHHYKNNC